jgi:quercetin dioxygenase-like cupin family protein
MSTLKSYRNAAEPKVLMMGRFPLTVRVSEADNGGHYSVVEQSLPPRGLVLPHVHATHDQLKVVLSGRCGMYVGGEEFVVEAGTTIFGPRGVPHAVWNAGVDDCSFLEMTSPGGFENYFPEFAALSDGDAPDLKARLSLAQRYGIEVLPEVGKDLARRHGLEL